VSAAVSAAPTNRELYQAPSQQRRFAPQSSTGQFSNSFRQAYPAAYLDAERSSSRPRIWADRTNVTNQNYNHREDDHNSGAEGEGSLQQGEQEGIVNAAESPQLNRHRLEQLQREHPDWFK
jgi:hypothetical protein